MNSIIFHTQCPESKQKLSKTPRDKIRYLKNQENKTRQQKQTYRRATYWTCQIQRLTVNEMFTKNNGKN